MKNLPALLASTLLLVLLAMSCREEDSAQTVTTTAVSDTTSTSLPVAPATATSPPTVTPLPTDTPTPAPTPTPALSTPAEIFASVSPAVAYVETAGSSGSALLVEGGYLVTNAHVVWPNTAVQVTFPDGTVSRTLPVVGWDLIADVAVLGPVRVSAEPISLSDASVPPIGSEVLTVGYPGSPGRPSSAYVGAWIGITISRMAAGRTHLHTVERSH